MIAHASQLHLLCWLKHCLLCAVSNAVCKPEFLTGNELGVEMQLEEDKKAWEEQLADVDAEYNRQVSHITVSNSFLHCCTVLPGAGTRLCR